MELRERLARAICKARHADPDGRGPQRRFAVDREDGTTGILTDHMGPLWTFHAKDADAILAELESAGLTIVASK